MSWAALGLTVFAVSGAYWVWLAFAGQRHPIATLRGHRGWDLLGNLSVIGMFMFVLGLTLIGDR